MNESGADGIVLDENDDADRYMLRTLTTSEGLPLVKSRVKPVTPPIAVAARVSGSVVTEVLVSKTGEVEKMRPISGPPMLIPASIEAAKKWTFAPLLIGSRPVQYQMQVEFTFFAPIASMPGAIKMAP